MIWRVETMTLSQLEGALEYVLELDEPRGRAETVSRVVRVYQGYVKALAKDLASGKMSAAAYFASKSQSARGAVKLAFRRAVSHWETRMMLDIMHREAALTGRYCVPKVHEHQLRNSIEETLRNKLIAFLDGWHQESVS